MFIYQHDEEKNTVSADRADLTTQSDVSAAKSRPSLIQKISALHGRYGNRTVQRMLNGSSSYKTTLPSALKTGIEALSNLSMDDVTVHYNSDKPAAVDALAFTQGTEIHLGPDQEKHLPHEAWHVAQQKQGRVRSTMQVKGMSINDDPALERESDVMGTKALQMTNGGQVAKNRASLGDGREESLNSLSPHRTSSVHQMMAALPAGAAPIGPAVANGIAGQAFVAMTNAGNPVTVWRANPGTPFFSSFFCHGHSTGTAYLHNYTPYSGIHMQTVLNDEYAIVATPALAQAGDILVWNNFAGPIHSAILNVPALNAAGNFDPANTHVSSKNGTMAPAPMTLASLNAIYGAAVNIWR